MSNLSFPAIIMGIGEAFIPGLGMANHIASSYFQIDLTHHIIVVFGTLAVLAGVIYVLSTIWSWLCQYVVVTAEIRYEDEMWNFVIFWITKQKFSHRATSFVASIRTTSASVLIGEDNGDKLEDDSEDMEGLGYNAKVRDKMKSTQFTPASGHHYFWYKRRPFVFTRRKNKCQTMWSASEAETIYISTIGRNTEPIKQLLQQAQILYHQRDDGKTVIYRAAKRHGSGPLVWTRNSSRPSRAMSTIILDKAQKDNIIQDMEAYLSWLTRIWYNNRGIPYRRGYLFHGPPGTGKTSLCYALAGHLNLYIYVLSLNSVSDDDLDTLFVNIPPRCIVLLEDIDSAGVTANRAQIKGKKARTKQDIKPVLNTREAESTSPHQITLSALLNVIDGVAASEGRIVIMTTNHIKKLDPAILRPGRIDLTICFSLASHEMIKGIFQAIYMGTEEETGTADGCEPLPRLGCSTHGTHYRSEEEIEILATRFADQMPVDEFTIAEIQGYLLHHKGDPEAAVDGVAIFISTLRDEKKEQKERAA